MATKTKVLPVWCASTHDFQTYFDMDMGVEYQSALESLLSKTWPRIQAALNSSGQGSCTLGIGMDEYLKELHIIVSGIMLNIAGIRLSKDQREIYTTMFSEQLTQILNGTVQVCEGSTNANVPFSGRIVHFG